MYSWLFFTVKKNLFNGRLRFSVRFVFPALREMTRKTEKSWITKLIRRFWCEVLQLVSIFTSCLYFDPPHGLVKIRHNLSS